MLGGPDVDPPVAQDVTYVLSSEAAARTYRMALGSEWLIRNRPGWDYAFCPKALQKSSSDGVPLLQRGGGHRRKGAEKSVESLAYHWETLDYISSIKMAVGSFATAKFAISPIL